MERAKVEGEVTEVSNADGAAPAGSYRTLFDRALKLRDTGKLRASLRIFDHLIGRYPNKPSVWGMRGAVLRLLDRKAEAMVSFREASWLSPRSELASLGLFHGLISLGRVEDAFLEAERFLGVEMSPEYSRLVAELLGHPLRATPEERGADIRRAGGLLESEMSAKGLAVFSSRKTRLEWIRTVPSRFGSNEDPGGQ